ncbi:hypothetical protein CCR75_007486 [Bremia lactucae]|uniref:Secreted RxLR effector n=1 Tax=Bremia lactucae TaxID=4779 RepID=A0A976FIT7_BRELC|nr:hypothetical protein CCR75_007486 [Bremia lactucae]
MVFPALFLLIAFAFGDAAATSMSNSLQTIPFSGTSVVSRRLNLDPVTVEKAAQAINVEHLLDICGKEKIVVGDIPSEFYKLADHTKHQELFERLGSHLKTLPFDDAHKDHAVISLMEKKYGEPAVAKFVNKALSLDPKSTEANRIQSAMLDRWKKEGLSVQEVAEKMTPKKFKLTKETLEDFPREMLMRYAVKIGSAEEDADFVTSAVLVVQFINKINTEEKLSALLPNLKAIQDLSSSDLTRILHVEKDATADIFNRQVGFVFLLFNRLRTSQDPFKTLGRVRSLYENDGRLKPFAKNFWPTAKDVAISSKMDIFVENVLPTTFAGKIRYFFRRMWFKLVSIFKKKSTPAVVSNHEIPKSEIPETTVTDVVDDTSNILKTPVNDDIAATSERPSSVGRSTVINAADNTGGDASAISKSPAAASAKDLRDVSKKADDVKPKTGAEATNDVKLETVRAPSNTKPENSEGATPVVNTDATSTRKLRH